jgi:MOSC domain-containing protein YiiM
VIAVARAGEHRFSKTVVPAITLIAGLGVEGDAHAGVKVQHRSRVAVDPDQPNLRQVHLIHAELFAEMAARGFAIGPGDLGENIVTQRLDLLGLPRGTRLTIGAAQIEITGLRNPCAQIEAFRPGLLAAVLDRARDGALIRKCGVMAVVLRGGAVRGGDEIAVRLPDGLREPLAPV